MDTLQQMRNDQIEYLINRKFPILSKILAAALRRESVPNKNEHLSQVAMYREELGAQNFTMISALYSAEREKEEKEKRDYQESQRFFSKSESNADFGYWSKAEYWTLEEAIALAFGKDPQKVTWGTLAFYTTSPFVKEYGKLRELATRAKNWKKLFDPVYPIIFVRWAKDNDIPFPEGLEKLVVARNGNLIDWKKKYEESLQEYVALQEDYKDYQGKFRELIELNKQNGKIKDGQIAKLEEKLQTINVRVEGTATEKALSINPKERESMLKLIIAMAIEKYRYNPEATRNTATKNILNDLEHHGIPLDDEVILKYLREGAEILKEKQQEKEIA